MEQSAKVISSKKVEPVVLTMSIDTATEVMECDVPDTPVELCNIYTQMITRKVKEQTYPSLKELIGNAYTTIYAQLMSQQIETTGSFDISVDFSGLDKVHIFSKKYTGVEICPVCNGIGGIIKFNKKPKDVECLKCKEQDYIYFNKKDDQEYHVVISGNQITVDDVDYSNDPDFTKLLGWRVEDCLSCNGKGKIISDYGMKDLVVKVTCKTCGGRKLHPNSEKTQVLTKCKTCQGTRLAKVMVISPEIQHISICRKCKGIGFLRPTPLPDNPVITKDLAEKIKSL